MTIAIRHNATEIHQPLVHQSHNLRNDTSTSGLRRFLGVHGLARSHRRTSRDWRTKPIWVAIWLQALFAASAWHAPDLTAHDALV